jgi:hypothetical protein
LIEAWRPLAAGWAWCLAATETTCQKCTPNVTNHSPKISNRSVITLKKFKIAYLTRLFIYQIIN